MEKVTNYMLTEKLLKAMPPEVRAKMEAGELQHSDSEQYKVDCYNRMVGSLTGYDCPQCLNRGYFEELRDQEVYNYRYRERVRIDCKCLKIRYNLERIRKSGLAEAIASMTFESFMAEEPWQVQARKIAMEFREGWLYIGGQVGSGKSHLGTAVLGRFMHSGKSARYMMWRDEIVEIKAKVGDTESYSKVVEPLKKTELLYIDDFFKTEKGKLPTQADINFAHELLNYRYVNKLPTIISSELFVSDLLNIDEAVGSRIYQMSKGQCVEIAHDKAKNWRLR